LAHCTISIKSLTALIQAFKKNYGMSLSIENLDLSFNKLGKQGSSLLGNWLNMIRSHTHMRHLYLSTTSLSFVFIGRPLAYFTQLVTLDLSYNKLEPADSQLLTLVLESNKALRNLDLSGCGLNGEYAGKILSVILSNPFVTDVKVRIIDFPNLLT
jgi:Ran GTPase-activating protein (RanGAP) involved in mRNA processing and transport